MARTTDTGSVTRGGKSVRRASPVDDYLAAQPAAQRAVLERIRRVIHATAPGAEECISYGMPAFRVRGHLVAGFKGGAKHCSYHPMSGTTITTLAEQLAGYPTSKGTIRFAVPDGLPDPLVRLLVTTRLAETVAAGREQGDST